MNNDEPIKSAADDVIYKLHLGGGENLILLHAFIKGADQPVQLHCLTSSSDIQSLESRKAKHSARKISIFKLVL